MRRHARQPRIRGQVLMESDACRERPALIGIGSRCRLGFNNLGSFTDERKQGGVGDRLH